MLPPTTRVSFTLIAVLVGAGVLAPLGEIPNAPVNLSPEAVFDQIAEGLGIDTSSDKALVESRFGQQSPFFAFEAPTDIFRVVYVGATRGEVGIQSSFTTPYEDVANILKDAI